MTAVLAVICAALSAACLWLVLRLLRNRPAAGETSGLELKLHQEMAQLQSNLDAKILELSRQMNGQLLQNSEFLSQSHRSYQDAALSVERKLGEVNHAAKTMLEIGRDISSLQNILRSPKLRGGMGELFLEELLKQILPPQYFALQYGFRDGSKVDAALLLEPGIVPIDSKFPLENFTRIFTAANEEDAKASRKLFIADVKKHVDSIAAKYIQPDEGTFDFALMYIAAENVYYEAIIKDDSQQESLAEYARRKNVIPVSPNSFYAYLQAIMRGVKGYHVAQSARMILEGLSQIETEFKKTVPDFEKIGTHLNNALSAYSNTGKRLEKLGGKLSALAPQTGHPEPVESLEEPKEPQLL
jgi:DNA recombination protein RmuC